MPKLSQLTDYDPMGNFVGAQPVAAPTDTPATPISNNIDKILNSLFRDDEKRMQLWPEKLLRAGTTAAGNVMSGEIPQWSIDPKSGDVHTSPQMVEAAQEMSALAGTGGLGGAGGTLNATPSLRPALRHKEKLYKGKPGQEHQDIIPDSLYNDFQKKAMSGEDLAEYNFGFVNDKGHFLSREDALKYGIDNGLIDPQAGKYGALTSTLFADSSKPGTAIEAMKAANPFFSALEHNVKQVSQSKMTGEQWLGTLGNKPGVKPEELQWTGLADFLAENKGKPVTKAQIEEHLAQNKVELKEVTKGDPVKVSLDEALAAHSEGKPIFATEKGNPNSVFNIFNDRGEILPYVLKNKDKYDFRIGNHADFEQGRIGTKYHSYQLPGGPLSRDTEILTDKGWKRIDAVEVGDVVMTRKDEAGILEWQPVQAIPKVYAEELYHFFSQSINMRVTENHQMIAKKRRRNNEGLQRLTAKELWNKSEMLVPLTGVWEGGETENIFGFDPHDLAELFGWYLAEGSYKHKNGNKHTIQIAQCKEYNPEKCARLEALLDRMGLPWRYYGQAYGIGIKTINKDLVELFHEQPTSEFKFVPYFFFNQSKSIIQSLLDGLILGDGCIHINEGRLDRTVFYTKSEQLAGDVQILILLIGKNANVRQRPSGLYCVGIKSKEWSSVDDAKFEIAPYNDFAFCVTVENHAIYVRRNGVAAFTGNSNYREMLLTLPPKGPEFDLGNKAAALSKSLREKYGERWLTEAPPNEVMKYDILINQAEKASKGDYYKSSHWDEPNILAHVRMNDRTIDGKKSLHLEEIQSDWHQQGRDRGYRPEQEKKLASLVEQREKLQKEASTLATSDARYKEIYKELPTLQTEINKIGAGDVGVPDAPFKKSWHELALKRMLREAAEKGYDRLSWTPGEAQAARYDLSKQVDKIAVPMVNKDGTRSVRIDAKEGTPFKLMVNKEGKVTGAGASSNQFSGKPLSDVVGKEMADKIMKLDKPHEFAGEGLKIGGEGMKGFYDQIIPKALEKLGKEHGVKVKQDFVANKEKEWPFSIRVASDGKKYWLEGLDPRLDHAREVSLSKKFDSFTDADILRERFYKGETEPVHYIDIPQSLRDTATQKGFPLFSAGGYMLVPVAGNPFEKKQ